MMILIDIKVKHMSIVNNRGEGIIVSQSDNKITVKFGSEDVCFKYPQAFESKMLKAIDNEIQDEILRDIQSNKHHGISNKYNEGIFDKIEKAEKSYCWIDSADFGNIREDKKLIVGKCYGTKAQDIFDACCDIFGWKKSERGKFAQRQIMYSAHAANGIGVALLPNHHFNSKNDGTKHWHNIITQSTIYELWNTNLTELFYNNEKRVVFVKAKHGYVYLGVFEPRDRYEGIVNPRDGKGKDIKVFIRVQKDYEN